MQGVTLSIMGSLAYSDLTQSNVKPDSSSFSNSVIPLSGNSLPILNTNFNPKLIRPT
jgi:hypothetical protein